MSSHVSTKTAPSVQFESVRNCTTIARFWLAYGRRLPPEVTQWYVCRRCHRHGDGEAPGGDRPAADGGAVPFSCRSSGRSDVLLLFPPGAASLRRRPGGRRHQDLSLPRHIHRQHHLHRVIGCLREASGCVQLIGALLRHDPFWANIPERFSLGNMAACLDLITV